MADSHADLCAVAVRWLKRPNSAGGHGCTVAVSECRSGYGGEIPDAIGFRANWNNGSVVVEVKVSRSDFLADRNKPHRQAGGMGTWRYYMAPVGVLKPADLPEKWGLLEVGKGKRVKPVAGPAALSRNCGTFSDHLDAWRHDPDHDAERDLLTLLLARVGDADRMNQRIKEANNANSWLQREITKVREQNRSLQARLFEKELARPFGQQQEGAK